MFFFEWNPEKAKRNLETHGVSFDEASTAFGDAFSLTIYETFHRLCGDKGTGGYMGF
jgi:uncharacterized DUF497 family protein